MSLLYILDILAELIHLVFQLGVLTRKYGVPAAVFAYVAVEASVKWILKFYYNHLSPTLELGYS